MIKPSDMFFLCNSLIVLEIYAHSLGKKTIPMPLNASTNGV